MRCKFGNQTFLTRKIALPIGRFSPSIPGAQIKSSGRVMSSVEIYAASPGILTTSTRWLSAAVALMSCKVTLTLIEVSTVFFTLTIAKSVLPLSMISTGVVSARNALGVNDGGILQNRMLIIIAAISNACTAIINISKDDLYRLARRARHIRNFRTGNLTAAVAAITACQHTCCGNSQSRSTSALEETAAGNHIQSHN